MENISNNLEINENFHIIGEKDQVLQLILKRNDSVICKKPNIYYLSSHDLEEISYSKLQANADTNIGTRIKDSRLVKIKNKANTFEYIGIYNGGRIMKIIPFIYKDLFIRFDCLIAHSENIELLEVKEIRTALQKFHKNDGFIFKDHRFYMVHSMKLKHVDIDNFGVSDYHYIRDYLFLSNESNTR